MAGRRKKQPLVKHLNDCPKCGWKGSLHQVTGEFTYTACYNCGLFHEHGASFHSLAKQIATGGG